MGLLCLDISTGLKRIRNKPNFILNWAEGVDKTVEKIDQIN
jgi:hypothetical protein